MSHAPESEDDRQAISGEDLTVGLRVLADLLGAQLPLTRALQAFEDLAPPSWRIAVPALRASVRNGQGLSVALASAPLLIPQIVIGIVRAGEEAGGSAAAVRRAADHMEEIEAARAALRSALAYPLAVAVAGSAAIVLMTTVVLPRFERLLSDLGQSLPWSTRVVLSAAGAVRSGALPVVVIAALLAVTVPRVLSEPARRRRLDALLLDLPLLGQLRLSIATSRFCGALAALLESGVPLRLGLLQAGHVIHDTELLGRLAVGREAISGGASIGRTFGDLAIVTPTAARLAAAGEETGGLASMLAFAARLERSRSERTLNTLVRLLEPALIVCFAGIVALVAAALLQAVYSVKPA